MNAKDLRNKTDTELKEDLLKLRKELFNIRFQKINGVLDNLSQASVLKKNLARIKTVLTEKSKNIR